MVYLDDILDKGIKKIVSNLIKLDITKQWLKDILEQKYFCSYHFGTDLDIEIFFEIYIWDNLNDEQKNKVIEYLNILIEEDILIDRQPFGNYCFDLLDLAIVINKLCPGKVNYKPFIIWKEKHFYNLSEPEKIDHPVRKELANKIEYFFERKK